MKKILFITSGFDGRGGGKIASIMENYFSKKYETITLVTYYDGGFFPIMGKKINIGSIGKSPFPLRGYIALMFHLINTIRYIKKEKPDFVICIGSYNNFLGLVAKRFLKFKLLLTQHEHITLKIKIYATLLDKIVFKLNKFLIGKTNIVCVSKEVMEDTIRYYGISKEQANVIYNGFDFDSIKRLGNEKFNNIEGRYIINIGALSSAKNQEMLIRSYSKSKIKKQYKLVFLGDGLIKKYLINLTKKLGIEKNVIFAGFDNNPYKFLKNSSLFCFTSLSEALPTVLIEALILKVPIITVPVIGSKEILDNGNCGIISKDWNVNGFTELINNYINKDNSDLVDRGYNFAEDNFKISTMMQQYDKLINKL